MLNNMYNWAMQNLYINRVLTSQSKYLVYHIILEYIDNVNMFINYL